MPTRVLVRLERQHNSDVVCNMGCYCTLLAKLWFSNLENAYNVTQKLKTSWYSENGKRYVSNNELKHKL